MRAGSGTPGRAGAVGLDRSGGLGVALIATPESRAPAGRRARLTAVSRGGDGLAAGFVVVVVVVDVVGVLGFAPVGLLAAFVVVLLTFLAVLFLPPDPLLPAPLVAAFFFLLVPPPCRFGPLGALPTSIAITDEKPSESSSLLTRRYTS